MNRYNISACPYIRGNTRCNNIFKDDFERDYNGVTTKQYHFNRYFIRLIRFPWIQIFEYASYVSVSYLYVIQPAVVLNTKLGRVLQLTMGLHCVAKKVVK